MLLSRIQILLLEAAERAPPSENDLPMATTATWYDDLLPGAIPLTNPENTLRKQMGPVGELSSRFFLSGYCRGTNDVVKSMRGNDAN